MAGPLAYASIAASLEAVIGSPLLRVSYWLLAFDAPYFSLEVPNESGLCAVRMSFETSHIEIYPSWDKRLLNQNAYHLQAQFVPLSNFRSECPLSEKLVEVTADDSRLWRDALTTPLVSANLYGFGASPQVVRFQFPSAQVVVAIGYAGEEALIGDGDEILVFPNDAWKFATKTLSDPLDQLWVSSSIG